MFTTIIIPFKSINIEHTKTDQGIPHSLAAVPPFLSTPTWGARDSRAVSPTPGFVLFEPLLGPKTVILHKTPHVL